MSAMNIQIPVSELKKKKLFLAAPMYGGICAGMFARSVADLAAMCVHYGVQLQMYFLFNESLIPRARNYCCDEFMRSDAGHLMFIDSDIGFNPQDVIALLALQSDESPYDIIGGPYPKKCISWEKIKMAVDKGFADDDPNKLDAFVGDYVFNPKGGVTQIPLGQPVEVLEIGTGFMMVRRKAMEKFRDSFPQYHYKPDHVRTEHFDGSREIMQYFQAEIDIPDKGKVYEEVLKSLQGETDAAKIQEIITTKLKEVDEKTKAASKRYLSEDYWFCQKIQEIGMKTWLCPWMKLQHVGTMIFGGSLIDIAQLGASATADPDSLAHIKKRKEREKQQQLQKKSA